MDDNEAIRAAAIRHCRLLALSWGDAIPAVELTKGFPHGYGRLKLITWGRGIFKPQQLTDGPLTLVSSLASSYEDEHLDDDTGLVDYAPSPSNDWPNEGLERAVALGRSVVLLRQVKAKSHPEYMVLAPVAITGFDDVARRLASRTHRPRRPPPTSSRRRRCSPRPTPRPSSAPARTKPTSAARRSRPTAAAAASASSTKGCSGAPRPLARGPGDGEQRRLHVPDASPGGRHLVTGGQADVRDRERAGAAAAGGVDNETERRRGSCWRSRGG